MFIKDLKNPDRCLVVPAHKLVTQVEVAQGFFEAYYDHSNYGNCFVVPSSPVPRNYMPTSSTEQLIEVMTAWLDEDNMARKAKFGFPNRVGVLLYGPPGSGKTSAINYSAYSMMLRGFEVVVINDTEPSNAFTYVKRFRDGNEESKIIVVWDEFDKMLFDEEVVADALTWLDGIGSFDNVMTVAVTNFPERLPVAMLDRPGRFARIIEFDGISDEDRIKLIRERCGDFNYVDELIESTKGMQIDHILNFVQEVTILGVSVEEMRMRLKATANLLNLIRQGESK